GDGGGRPVARKFEEDRDGARRARGRRRQHEPAARQPRPLAERAAEERQRGRAARVGGRRGGEPGGEARGAAGTRGAGRAAVRGDDQRERSRAAYPDRASIEGKPDDTRGSVTAIRHLARAGAPDRGARLRKIAESDQGRRDRTPPGDPLILIPCPPLAGGRTC